MVVAAAATFGMMVRHGTANGAPAGWGSLTVCTGRAGDAGRGAAAAAPSGRLGKMTAGEKY